MLTHYSRLFRVVVAAGLFAMAAGASAQTLAQADFTGVVVPQYGVSGGTSRLPVVFRATVTNLAANTSFRYFTQAAAATDFGGSTTGAGNAMLISPDGSTYVYTTAVSLTSAGNYGTFTTNASGEYTGWFAYVNTANARFNAAAVVYPSIAIGNIDTGAVVARRALDVGVTCLALGATGANSTGIWGASNSPAKDMVALFDNTAGTGRPLAMTYVESEGITVASAAAFYDPNVNGVAGRWGNVVPNTLANGVRRVARYSGATGALVTADTDSDGVWPSSLNTVNPTGGTAPLAMTLADAPLPVSMSAFSID